MTYSVWQSFITNGVKTISGAVVSVFHEGSGTPAALFSSPSGGSIGSSVTSDSSGLARFYVAAGVYRITVTHASFSAEHRHVRIGEMAGVDDAPSDGKQYARKDGDWEEVEDYTRPTASVSVLGGVKVGGGLSIDGGGVLSSTAGSTLSNRVVVEEGTDFDITLPLNSNIKLRLKKTTGVQEVELYFKFDSLHNCWCYGSQFSDAAVETKISVQGDTTTEKSTDLKVFNKGSSASDRQYVQMNLASQSNNNKWQLTLFCSYYTSTKTNVFYQLSTIS
jgi:hypothetical protein